MADDAELFAVVSRNELVTSAVQHEDRTLRDWGPQSPLLPGRSSNCSSVSGIPSVHPEARAPSRASFQG